MVTYDILKTGSRSIAVVPQVVVITVNTDDVSNFLVKPFLPLKTGIFRSILYRGQYIGDQASTLYAAFINIKLFIGKGGCRTKR